MRQFWPHRICKHYQSITSIQVFTVVFGIYCFFNIFGIQTFSLFNLFNWEVADLLFFLFGKAKFVGLKNQVSLHRIVFILLVFLYTLYEALIIKKLFFQPAGETLFLPASAKTEVKNFSKSVWSSPFPYT